MSELDYLNPPPLAKSALTPNSTAGDAAGLTEILKLITDPAAHRKQLAELQRMTAEVDRRINEAARREIELKKQIADFARLRQDFDAQLAIDRANHVAETQRQERALVAKIAEFNRVLAGTAEVTDAV